jgi:trimeric autotransporter adhesin
MKTKLLIASLLISTLNSQLSTAFAQGTAFAYQGRLTDGANPASGLYDIRFAIYDALASGTQQVGTVTNSAVGVSNGLFTVALDFGNQFPGAGRWLEIAVRTNGNGGFFTLSPRQALTPAPYAITAGSVVSGGLNSGTYGNAVTLNNANNSFSGAFSGNGGAVTNVNAASLGGLTSSNFWQLGGNNVAAGRFLGSTNNQPLELRVNNQRVMQFAYASNAVSGYSPNLIGGHAANYAGGGVVGATIAGGGNTGVFGTNAVLADFGTVLGGQGNTAGGKYSTVGGLLSTASGQYSTALGGASTAEADYAAAFGQSTASGTNALAAGNSIASGESAVALGRSTASGAFSTALGSATASGPYTTATGFGVAAGSGSVSLSTGVAEGAYSVTMGNACHTTPSATYGFAAGHATTVRGVNGVALGSGVEANHDGSFVWGDNSFLSGDRFASSADNQFLIRAIGGVGIGLTNPAAAVHVASASGLPQLRLTQNTTTDYTRLRMNVGTNPSWEMDVSPGATPGLSWWTSTLKMNLDFNGNLTTAGTVNGTSDRNAKEKFTRIDPLAVLEKVTALPITEWNYKTDGESLRHIGPMSQDFHAAFNVGTDDKHISMVDADGVALAAIQGLNEKVEDRRQKSEVSIRKLEAENAELKRELAEIKQLLTKLSTSKN